MPASSPAPAPLAAAEPVEVDCFVPFAAEPNTLNVPRPLAFAAWTKLCAEALAR